MVPTHDSQFTHSLSLSLSSSSSLLKTNSEMKMEALWLVALLVATSSIMDLRTSAQAVVPSDGGDDTDTGRAISIDCGVTQDIRDSNGFYHDADDAEFVESGKIYNLSSYNNFDNGQEQVWEQMRTLRSFPEGKRNCYSLKPRQGKNNNYLIRVYMFYGNYDNKNFIPSFHLHIGVNFWTEIKFENASVIRRKTVAQVSPTNYIDVCLINIGNGIPFVSLLELWPLSNFIYRASSSLLPLGLMTCVNLGMSEDLKFIRYADDIYGRSWFNVKLDNSERFSTPEATNVDVKEYRLPDEVLRTAVRPLNNLSSLYINLTSINFTAESEHYVYLHFFDFEEHSQGQVRSMEITFTDEIRDAVTLRYQDVYTLAKRIPKGVLVDRIVFQSHQPQALAYPP
ncbi:putative leucine-rich repeat receptor-like serine/threonine-protein kinase At2g19230 [Neltuma alba]|uniref:putative leucine-rich repeat receptor-like serine/threonine-protein kinase At2g19230 n=1 Tax=Neltuma alba TaxID=207710 RepID=UPI0010A4C691|nr:putative leucine-rich repeat receptor-like serine/threonine-protein kinase At2g19230 [Prosopis alba]